MGKYLWRNYDYCSDEAVERSPINMESVDQVVNGHIYEVSQVKLSYVYAKKFCQCRGGELAFQGIRTMKERL